MKHAYTTTYCEDINACLGARVRFSVLSTHQERGPPPRLWQRRVFAWTPWCPVDNELLKWFLSANLIHLDNIADKNSRCEIDVCDDRKAGGSPVLLTALESQIPSVTPAEKKSFSGVSFCRTNSFLIVFFFGGPTLFSVHSRVVFMPWKAWRVWLNTSFPFTLSTQLLKDLWSCL